MKKLFTLVTIAAFAFSIAMIAAADDKKKRDFNAERTVTYKGNLKCAKCLLKLAVVECQAALEITRYNKSGKGSNTTRVILLKNDDVTKAFHKEICKAAVFSAVTGKYEGKGKARILVASKIEKAKFIVIPTYIEKLVIPAYIEKFNNEKVVSDQNGKRTLQYWKNLIRIGNDSLSSLKADSNSDEFVNSLKRFNAFVDEMSTRGVDVEAVQVAEAITELYQKPITQLEIQKKNTTTDALEAFAKGYLFGIPGILSSVSDAAEKEAFANKEFIKTKGKLIAEQRKVRNSLTRKYNLDFPVIYK